MSLDPVPRKTPMTDPTGSPSQSWDRWLEQLRTLLNNAIIAGGAVTSVNSRIGAVVVTKSDVLLANVDNTSDVNKPISTAQQAAIDLKANLSSPTFTGTVTAPTFAGALTGNVTGNVSGTAGSFTGSLLGDVTGTQGATAIAAATVTGKALTGYSSGSGTISATDTVLQAIQKLNGNDSLKAPVASPTFTGTATTPALNISGQNASTVPYLDASKNLVSSAVTPTQLGFLDATSSVQTQLNAKQATGNYITSLTTDVVASGAGAAAATIQTGVVTNAKLATVATATFKGRTTAGTGAPEDLTVTQATALLNAVVGDAGSGGTKGLVPAPASGDAAALKFLKADGTWSTPAGSSGAFGNLITAYDGSTTTGWSLGTTGTLTNAIPTGTPTFGSGAAGTLVLSSTAVSPLRGANSLSLAASIATVAGNMLATNAITIDPADRAKVLTFKFEYSPTVNPSNGNWSGTSSNSFGVACYDVTNSSWLPVVGNFAMTQSSGVGVATGTMQTNSTTASLRFMIYAANASAGAITVLFDNFFLGQQTIEIGAPVTDWVAYTPTGAWVTNSTHIGRWRRVGDSMELDITTTLAGAPTAAEYTVTIPSGYTIDTAKITSTDAPKTLGSASLLCAANYYSAFPWYSSTTTLKVSAINKAAAGTHTFNNISNTTPDTFANGDRVYIRAMVPISGWSSNVQMSNDTDTRVLTTTVAMTAAYVVGANAVLKYDTVLTDKGGTYSAATGLITATATGSHTISATVTAAAVHGVYVKVNGVSKAHLATIPVAGYTCSSSITLPLNAGDTVGVYSDSADTHNGSGTNGYYNTFSLSRLSGPAVIAATDSVNAKYYASGAGTASTTVPVNFDTKSHESHNGSVTTGAAWKFTAPSSGLYSVTVFLATNSPTAQRFTLYKNGVGAASTGNDFFDASNNFFTNGTVDMRLNAGDYIDVRPGVSDGWLLGSTISIKRVGN